jgi:hypothetical protein
MAEIDITRLVEGRVPFLDHYAVEFLGRLPVHLNIRGLAECRAWHGP